MPRDKHAMTDTAEKLSGQTHACFFGLVRRKQCLFPTFRGWLMIGLAIFLAGAIFVSGVYGFLAVQDSVPGGVLVAEGWVPDFVLVETLAEFHRHHYDGIFVTGMPMEKGAILSEYKTTADLSAAILIKLGADPLTVYSVPTTAVLKDRTYATAVALREDLAKRGLSVSKVNVISLGAHSRRTRLLYEHAFGPSVQVGIIAMTPRDFDSSHWWRTSQGFRGVTDEITAYLYARFFFSPK